MKYQSQLQAGDFVVLAHGEEADVEKAKRLLEGTSAKTVDSYSARQLAGVS